MPSPGGTRPSVRRELLFSVVALFVGAVVLSVAVVAVALPFLQSPGDVLALVTAIVAADLVILFLFVRRLLARTVLEPLERIGHHAERISEGDFHQGIPPEEGEELERLVRSLNAMAQRLIEDQERLAENVRSLDDTNRELVETTEELVRAARMASVGTLAAGLAHEVGNPLGALIASLDSAGMRLERGGDPVEALESAREEAGRIDRIIRSILEFARPGAEDARIIQAVALEELLERITTLLEGRGALGGVPVEWSVAPDTPLVRGRPQHLEQVLVNLIMNAVKAMRGSPDPRVLVSAEPGPGRSSSMRARRAEDPPGIDYSHRRRIPALIQGEALDAGDGADVVVRIEDTGPGIPEADLDRLFDPFFTTREPGEGTGMGLAITSRIVQELGGVIRAENRSEGGARFILRFPAATAEDPSDGSDA
jgi:two-component system, NtrC family, sensor kinase